VSQDKIPSEERAVPPTETGTESILLVDDERMLRAASRRILRSRGYQVLEAASGAEAIRLLESEQLTVDLVVCDLVIPDMNGRDVVARLRALRPGLAAIYVSGLSASMARQEGLLGGGDPFMQKPFTPSALTQLVRHLLDARQRS
jgi:CheY-like chemotaxis protein